MIDDRLEQRIRAARPFSGNRNLPLSDRAKRELAELLLTASTLDTPARTINRTRKPPLFALAAVFVVAIALIPLWQNWSPRSAQAATPPLLAATPLAGDPGASATLSQLSDTAAKSAPIVRASASAIEVQTWTLSVTENGTDREFSSEITPENYSITRTADDQLSITVTAGPSTDSAGELVTAADLPAEGTLLWEATYTPADDPYLFDSPAPTDPSLVGEYLSEATGTNATTEASATILATEDLLLEQTLEPAQASALLTHLATLPDIDIEGTVTDRLGRSGILFSTVRSDDPDYTDNLVVSPTDGTILATETIYTGEDHTYLTAPAVQSYYAWRTP